MKTNTTLFAQIVKFLNRNLFKSLVIKRQAYQRYKQLDTFCNHAILSFFKTWIIKIYYKWTAFSLRQPKASRTAKIPI